MQKITLFDTSIATTNIGDEIIVDGVKNELYKLFNEETMFFSVPTHEKIGYTTYKLLKSSNAAFVAGTNLLSSNYRILRPKSWKLGYLDINFINNEKIILMGVGWASYQDKPSFLAEKFYKKILSSDYMHSVRDSYTEEKLKSIGITNVINTGCATMWNLTPELCATIPQGKARSVVFTLTDYNKDEEKDQKLIDYLEALYENVYFWIQGAKDYKYIESLNHTKVKYVNPTLQSYDKILNSHSDLDYVGTRLHAGIRALQNRRRTIIIGIDNRAKEKKKDFNIKVIDRENIDQLPKVINSSFKTNIHLNIEAIEQWKSQFM